MCMCRAHLITQYLHAYQTKTYHLFANNISYIMFIYPRLLLFVSAVEPFSRFGLPLIMERKNTTAVRLVIILFILDVQQLQFNSDTLFSLLLIT